MKIIDKTPLLDENGKLGIMQRIQGMLEYGFNWPRELEAQNAIIKYFDRQLEKGYTLIRNLPLGQSGIVIPMILLGPTGIYVIEVSHLRGRYEARADTWNVESGDRYAPARVNLIQRTMRMARALQAFIERQGMRIPVTIDPVLIAGDPGLHIESVRPAIKVMMIDGIKAFVNGLVNGSPVLSSMQVNDFTDHILNPRAKPDMSAPPAPEPEPEADRPAWEEMYGWSEQQQEPSRSTLGSAEEAQPYQSSGFDFAMAEEEAQVEDIPPVVRVPDSAEPARRSKPSQQLIMGMTSAQVAVLAGLALLFFCILAIFVYVVIN